MSMIGEYVRVTPAELERVLGDPEGAPGLVGRLVEADLRRPRTPSAARSLGIGTAWDALGFLLRRVGFPVDIARGEEPVPGADDWGYGPPRHLAADRVGEAAEALAKVSGEELVAGVTPRELADADVYPGVLWRRGESLDHVRGHYEALVPFFAAAARDGDAMLVWRD